MGKLSFKCGVLKGKFQKRKIGVNNCNEATLFVNRVLRVQIANLYRFRVSKVSSHSYVIKYLYRPQSYQKNPEYSAVSTQEHSRKQPKLKESSVKPVVSCHRGHRFTFILVPTLFSFFPSFPSLPKQYELEESRRVHSRT